MTAIAKPTTKSSLSKRLRVIVTTVVAFVLATVMALGAVGCSKKGSGKDSSTPLASYVNKATSKVGYYGKVTNSNVKRNKPVSGVHDEGLDSYPVYGTNYNGAAAQNDIISESSFLTATGTANAGGGGYTWMDEKGHLYGGTRAEPANTGRQLYKHTASVGLYRGDVSDSEPGVEKVVSMSPRGYSSYGVTGIYAAAGEVIKIQISEADMEATGGLTIHIGQALYNGQANNIWAGKAMPRMPHLLNTMQVNKNTAVLKDGVYTAYVGSFLGGPLYIRNAKASFTVTISGGVEYPHFILGYTTEAEYARLKKTSTPYFDLEVWNYGVLHSGPRVRAESFSYKELHDAAVLWEKVASVTTTGSNQGIVFIYDPFVAAGAAVAFPGRSSVNCPDGWMSNSLNYKTIVTSGAWGNFHEYHHNFQGFGVGEGGEVTNNSLTLVSYALFTNISQSRSMNNYGAGNMGGWNRYTSATWALEQTLKIARSGESPENGNKGLALYATLLHNFGPDNFIKTKVKGGGQSYAAYKSAWESVTHNNMDYYFNDILGGNTGTSSAAQSYPTFVPVSSVYQTGRSYIYDGAKKYIKTMQPYLIKQGEPFTVDLSKYTVTDGQYASGSIIVPDGVTYEITDISQPENGTIEKITDTSYTYLPDSDKASGEIKVTLSLKKGGTTYDPVDLILEFQPTKELNKTVLERTIYTYASDAGYASATDAFDNNFGGYQSVETVDHSNPTQNSNTDIWYWGNSQADHDAHPDAPDFYFYPEEKTVSVVDGKLYFEDDGKYRVYLRGRYNCALYFSLDGNDYKLGGKIADNKDNANFRTGDPNTYFDVEFSNGNVKVYLNGSTEVSYQYKIGAENWLYIKEVLVAERKGKISYIGVGVAKWEQSLFTMAESETDDYTEITYKDSTGKAIAAQRTAKKGGKVTYYEVNNGTYTETTAARVGELTTPKLVVSGNPAYASAYRKDYELPENAGFESDYFYTRDYTYNYTDNVQLGVGEQTVVESQCANLNLSKSWGGSDLSVVVDGITNAGGTSQLHTASGLNADKPFTLAIDLGNVYMANRLVIYSQGGRSDPQFPKDLKLYASIDGENYKLVKEFTGLPSTGSSQTLDFDETQMRYYKIEITASSNTYIIIRELEMWHINEINGGTQLSPDNTDFIYKGNWTVHQAFSSFGHVYVGKKSARMSFNITGSRVGILSSSAFGKKFEVRIDGKKVNSIALKSDDGTTVMTYLCDQLTGANHKVEIVCLGETSIDSIVVYP